MPRPDTHEYVEIEEGYDYQKIADLEKIEGARILFEEVGRKQDKTDKKLHRTKEWQEYRYYQGRYDAFAEILSMPEESKKWLERQG